MLFSDRSIANYINKNFEPAWESVRPVALVTIDFGSGNKLRRTLHGNIATYVCTSDASIVDILPGLYKPQVYLQALKDIKVVTDAATGSISNSGYLKQYHMRMLTTAVRWQQTKRHDLASKTSMTAVTQAQSSSDNVQLLPDLVSNVVLWHELNDETAANETVRRRQIHLRLAQTAKAKPAQIHKWLYKEVLHCDLDDPYLGLQAALFDNYPFVD